MKGKFLKSMLLFVLLLCTPPVSYAQSTQASGTINDHEYVDLGLSVMWATCNVGASSPEEYGNYYAWGETKPKNKYTKDNYATYNKIMGDISGNPNYDAARANWGGTWRLPTKEEIKELINNCTTERTTLNGVNGRLVTSKINGNNIFLPATGSYYDKPTPGGYDGEGGNYWSSSPSMTSLYDYDAYEIFFSSEGFGWNCTSLYSGYSVRPVTEGSTTTKQQLQIASLPNGDIDGHEYVDLGLSVKWATCNVGASSPEEYGNYYAWGEISPKSEYTSKNCATWGKNMGDIAGNPNYDAARANWGGTWRLPTKEEIEELISKCKHTWSTQGGHNGYQIIGPNGNSIFLPAAGYRYESSLNDVGEHNYYWSSSPDESSKQGAYDLRFLIGSFGWYWGSRYLGRSVRPVTD